MRNDIKRIYTAIDGLSEQDASERIPHSVDRLVEDYEILTNRMRTELASRKGWLAAQKGVTRRKAVRCVCGLPGTILTGWYIEYHHSLQTAIDNAHDSPEMIDFLLREFEYRCADSLKSRIADQQHRKEDEAIRVQANSYAAQKRTEYEQCLFAMDDDQIHALYLAEVDFRQGTRIATMPFPDMVVDQHGNDQTERALLASIGEEFEQISADLCSAILKAVGKKLAPSCIEIIIEDLLPDQLARAEALASKCDLDVEVALAKIQLAERALWKALN